MSKESAIRSTVYSYTFFKEITWWVLSCTTRPSAWPSLLTYLPESQCVSTLWPIFSSQAHWSKPMLSPFIKISFTKTCFSIYITNSSVNFTWFGLLNQQKFNDRPLFKPWALCWICHYFELPQNKYVCEVKKICYKPIPNNVEFIFMEENSKK